MNTVGFHWLFLLLDECINLKDTFKCHLYLMTVSVFLAKHGLV
jgi:hypothetical protein